MNITEIAQAFASGKGAYPALSGGAYFIRPDGSVIDNDGRLAVPANDALKAVYDAVAPLVRTTDIQTLTNKTLTSPVLTTPKVADGDLGVTVTSANQTHASATVTIPNCGDAADEFVLKDTAQTLTGKTLTAPTINGGSINVGSGVSLSAEAATGSLDITASVALYHGETVTIGTDVYQACADAAQTLNDGSTIAIDIEELTTKGTVNLTVDTNPTANDTMTICETVYTFVAVADFDAAGEIPIGEDATATQASIVAAINGTDSVNTAHPYVTAGAFADNVSVITALIGGTKYWNGTSLLTMPTTETFTAETNLFSAAAIEGTDIADSNDAADAIAAAITASDTMGVGATASGDVVSLLGDDKSADLNTVTIETTITDAVVTGMSGGVTGLIKADSVVVTRDAAETLINKTLTDPIETLSINTHDYAAGTTAWTLSADDLKKSYHKATNASGGVNAVIPTSPGTNTIHIFQNASEQALTVKTSAGSGVEIANGKTAFILIGGEDAVRLTPDA